MGFVRVVMSSAPWFESIVPCRSHRVNDPDAVLVAANADLDESSRSVGSEEENDVVVFISDADPVA